MADARATVIALPLMAFCVIELLEGDERAKPLTLAVALAATVFFHPLVGVMTAAVVVVLVAMHPDRYGRLGVPALVGGGILALPQATTMVGVDLPSALGLLVIPPAIGAVWLFDRWDAGRRWFALGLRVVGRRGGRGRADRGRAQGGGVAELVQRLLPAIPGAGADRGPGRGDCRSADVPRRAGCGLLHRSVGGGGRGRHSVAGRRDRGPRLRGRQDPALLDPGVHGGLRRLRPVGGVAAAGPPWVAQARDHRRVPGDRGASPSRGADRGVLPRRASDERDAVDRSAVRPDRVLGRATPTRGT